MHCVQLMSEMGKANDVGNEQLKKQYQQIFKSDPKIQQIIDQIAIHCYINHKVAEYQDLSDLMKNTFDDTDFSTFLNLLETVVSTGCRYVDGNIIQLHTEYVQLKYYQGMMDLTTRIIDAWEKDRNRDTDNSQECLLKIALTQEQWYRSTVKQKLMMTLRQIQSDTLTLMHPYGQISGWFYLKLIQVARNSALIPTQQEILNKSYNALHDLNWRYPMDTLFGVSILILDENSANEKSKMERYRSC